MFIVLHLGTEMWLCYTCDSMVAMLQLEKMKGELETLKQEHAKQKVSDSSMLARLQGEQDHMSEGNKQTEVKFTNTKGAMRQRVCVASLFV